MKTFKKIREKIASEEVAQKIAGNIITGQNRIAGYLNEKTKHLSDKARLWALAVFCTAFGGYLLWLLVRAIR